jgi:ABC-type uncharacterized transport system fused permease/ATPase subunit
MLVPLLQDLVSSGGQTVDLSILKNVNGVLKPVSHTQQQLPQRCGTGEKSRSNHDKHSSIHRLQQQLPLLDEQLATAWLICLFLVLPRMLNSCNTAAVWFQPACLHNIQGTMTLLLGSPGSGKSTLLKLLSGRLNSKHLKVCRAECLGYCRL